ncbi:MAG: hypothetical protein IPI17_17750 [Nitrosomonas sp.]|nr:hypothetical protein [Nitrosomonas sp.]
MRSSELKESIVTPPISLKKRRFVVFIAVNIKIRRSRLAFALILCAHHRVEAF